MNTEEIFDMISEDKDNDGPIMDAISEERNFVFNSDTFEFVGKDDECQWPYMVYKAPDRTLFKVVSGSGDSWSMWEDFDVVLVRQVEETRLTYIDARAKLKPGQKEVA